MRFFPIIPLVILIIYVAIVVGVLIVCLINKKWRKRNNFRRIAMLGIIALILARPAFPNGANESQTNNLTIFFVVDMSNSMVVKDQNGGKKYRYEQVTEDINSIINAFPGSRYSIITLDTGIYTAMPISTNTDAARSAADNLMPKYSYYGIGTNLNNLLNYSVNRISNYSKHNPELLNALFVFSDGEDTSDEVVSISGSFKKSVSGGAVFGYGSKEGDVIKKIDIEKGRTIVSDDCIKYFGSVYRRDSKYCVISQMNEDILTRISTSLGVNYYHRESNKIPDEIINDIRKEIKYSGSESTDGYIDIYWILAIILLGLLIWDFYDSLNRLLLERTMKHA